MGVGAPLVVGGILNEWLVVGGIACAAASGVPGVFLDRRSAAGERVALAVLATGAALGAGGTARALLWPTAGAGLELAWSVPGGAVRIQVDALSAMFLLQIFVLSLLGAVYGLGYWKQTEHAGSGRKVRLFYGLVTAGMATLVAARNAVLFLAGWEIMAIAAFVLVSTEDQDHEVRAVGYIYLVATRVGTLCLFAMFALLFVARGSFELSGPIVPRPSLANAIFVLGFVGFGLKAGAMPFHVWLPGAHASAPSHVSALMSGVLIKMGHGFISELLIYVGLLRGTNAATGALALGFAFSAVGLALVGALALACFVKVSGAVFLGEPRSLLTARAHEAGTSMTFPMGVLAVLCAFIGTGSLLVTPILDRAAGASAPGLGLPSTATVAPLLAVTVMGGALVVLVAGLGGWLAARTRHAPAPVGTWDCGYVLPTARMQYTSSSFAQTLVGMFSWALRPRLHQTAPHGPFPHAASFHSHVPEVVLDELLVPAGRAVGHGLRWFRWVQRGSVHAYLVYILATLVLLLIRQGGR